jgi:2-hydroxy-6-oxonona-2,4-dienedioate hydrolase
MGAFLAARVGLERPDLLRSLVLVDTNTTAPDDPRYPWTAFYRELEQKTPPGPPTRDTVRLEPVAQSWSDAHVTDDFVERLYAIAQRPECGEAAARVKELREATWMPSILGARARNLEEIDERGLPVPTLIVWGADDPSAPLPLALALFDRIAARTEEVELHVLSHAGHYCFRERPEAFLRLVTGFCGDR